VGSSPPPLRRGPGERLAAWVVTGPPGHLWSVVADVGSFALKALGQRMLRGAAKRLRARR
jgi:hypothetical protein